MSIDSEITRIAGAKQQLTEWFTSNGFDLPDDAKLDELVDLLRLFTTGYTESDPTVPEWAKKATKPTYSATEVGAIATTGGTMTGTLTAANTAVGTSAVRNIKASTTDLVAGSSALTTGSVYLVYEA